MLDEVTGIVVVFENVESVYIPAEHLNLLEVKGISESLSLDLHYVDSDMGLLRRMTVCDSVEMVVKEFADTEEILKKGNIYSQSSDLYSGYMRVYDSQDITSIEYNFKDGSKEDIYVDYASGENYYDPNINQINTPVLTKEVPNGVHVRIADPKTIKAIGQVVVTLGLTKMEV